MLGLDLEHQVVPFCHFFFFLWVPLAKRNCRKKGALIIQKLEKPTLNPSP